MKISKIKFLIFLVLCFNFSGVAYALKPSPEQIAQFKKMSASEQRALVRSFGIELDGAHSDLGSQRISDPKIPRPRDIGRKRNQESSDSETEVESGDKLEDIVVEVEPLKPFGYELFAGDPSTFAPVDNVPVPLNYVIGPGDTVIIQLYGKERGTHEITVNRQGILPFPGIGPLTVTGKNFRELKQQIEDVVQQQMIGVKANISMGPLRSIQIFVLGDAYRPGTYTVSSLATMTNALFVSGGIKRVGSLRNVQLKRDGKIVSTLDLYELLLKGDTSKDVRLLPGDVIFIPPIGKTVGIMGEVKRPAIYEFKNRASASDLIEMAGGYLPTAFPSASRIERVSNKGTRTFVDLDLSTLDGSSISLKNGDLVRIYSILEKMDDAVFLSGHVNRPGGYEWRKGLRVSDLINSFNDLLPQADLGYAILKREVPPNREIITMKVSLKEAIQNKNTNHDLELQPRDELIVLSHSKERRVKIEKLLETLREQQQFGKFADIVTISGNVRYPGQYPLHYEMNMKDLIHAAGGYLPLTDKRQSLLISLSPNSSLRHVERISFSEMLDETKYLEPKSELIVFGLNSDRQSILTNLLKQLEWQASRKAQEEIVSISGAVKYPGKYPLIAGDSMSDLIEMAGGLLESAYLGEAEVTSQYIDAGEEFRIDHTIVQSNGSGLGVDYLLKAKDSVVIKKIPRWENQKTIKLSGEVKFPGEYPIAQGETLGDLIKRSGGLTEYADPEAVIFLRESLRKKEEELLQTIQQRLEKDVVKSELDAVGFSESSDNKIVEEKLLQQVSKLKATGRLVVNLSEIINGDKGQDVVLMDGDHLVVPGRIQEVSILGEVNFPTSHVHSKSKGARSYINLSGGPTRYSDLNRTYIIRKDGRVETGFKRLLFFIKIQREVNPGDSIVVPIESDSTSVLEYWLGVSQVLFQLATTAAALQTVGAI